MPKFKNDEERAIAYAAFKYLESMLESDGKIPAGFSMNVGGSALTINIPENTVISRDKGVQGDGKIRKAATQNTYGFGVIVAAYGRLKKMNQHKGFWSAIVYAIKETMTDPNKTVADEFMDDPEFVEYRKQVESLRASLPKREESTPRQIERSKAAPSVMILTPKRKVEAA